MKHIVTIFALLVCFAAQAYEPLIREDRIWEYHEFTYFTSYWSPFPCRHDLYTYKFDGTEEKYGKTYHIFKQIGWSYWDEKTMNDVTYGDSNSDESVIGLFREEDGKVYLLLSSYNDGNGYNDNNEIFVYYKDLNSSKRVKMDKDYEVLVYDFTHADSDEEFIAVGTNEFTEEDGPVMSLVPYLTISVDDSTENVGKVYTLQNLAIYNLAQDIYESLKFHFDENFDKTTIVEGVGNVGWGTFLIPQASSFLVIGSSSFKHLYEFNNMYDLDGNVIYSGKNLKNPFAGVEAVGDDAEEGDGRMFDLMGRELRGEPARGTVYIRNGKKEIAR